MARQAFFWRPCDRSPPPGAPPPTTARESTTTRCQPPFGTRNDLRVLRRTLASVGQKTPSGGWKFEAIRHARDVMSPYSGRSDRDDRRYWSTPITKTPHPARAPPTLDVVKVPGRPAAEQPAAPKTRTSTAAMCHRHRRGGGFSTPLRTAQAPPTRPTGRALESHAQGASRLRTGLSKSRRRTRGRRRVRRTLQPVLAPREASVSHAARSARGIRATPCRVAQTCVQETGCGTPR